MNETQRLHEALRHIVALVVDDEAAVRDATCRLMRRFFDRVDCAVDAKDALEKFAATRYDLLLCDLRMPGMDGLTLMQTLLERGYDPFRVIFSGTVDPVDSQNVAHMCFPKPVDFVMITQLLRALEAHAASKEG